MKLLILENLSFLLMWEKKWGEDILCLLRLGYTFYNLLVKDNMSIITPFSFHDTNKICSTVGINTRKLIILIWLADEKWKRNNANINTLEDFV